VDRVESTYGAPVLAVLPLSEDVAALASAGVFCRRFPDHPLSAQIAGIAAALVPAA
jgi:hypothetical protein